ncbi:MAG: trypsin-like serine protease [Gammaproteobacteria bacterium]|nr:trypsin-like serine protease [Gammaproteobacteria bacterium]
MRNWIMFLLLVSGCVTADEMMSTAETDRQATIDAAKARALELRRVLLGLDAEISAAEARTLPPGKRAGERTEGKIVNGVSTGAYPTAGALIRGTLAASAGSWCSGTLIGPQTFLTAAHCVDDDPDAEAYYVYLQHGGIFALNAVTMHPDYDFPHADLAVVELAAVVEGIAPTPLNTLPVPSGNRGDIVGYGRSGGFAQDYGIKRAGSVQIAPCEPQRPPSLLCWNFDDPVGAAGLDSNTCNADSGGPLYLQRAADAPLLLAGVTSGGSQSDCLAGDHSYDVDVQQFVEWIVETANGDTNASVSDALPLWGSDKVRTLRAEVEFTANLRFRNYTVTLPDGISRLRVAMNGHDQDNRNFDLYVKSGAAVSVTDNDCAQNGTGQYGFCEFADPVAGAWSILLDAKSGNGLAQVSATLFEE